MLAPRVQPPRSHWKIQVLRARELEAGSEHLLARPLDESLPHRPATTRAHELLQAREERRVPERLLDDRISRLAPRGARLRMPMLPAAPHGLRFAPLTASSSSRRTIPAGLLVSDRRSCAEDVGPGNGTSCALA